MSILNNKSKYGLLSKLFHWLTAAGLIVQIPLGFYLVDLDFDQSRVDIENYHILFGLIIFYATLIRLIFKLLTPTPDFKGSAFPGQKFIAKLNHLFLYLALLTITISGIFKKLFNGESLVIFFKKINLAYNFEFSEQFYSIHVLANYTLIGLIGLHILAVLFHKFLLKENILKRVF
ncbi:cytochrome b/b6 domain-containing protein [Candidatus Pelagibacter sp.]|nr:cytochrome b/b6 domain-containing protein [Candidatus Pelagibacter sp.]MDC1159210.1 cytochrome b/b6 domain-containing protein [Candidatus Pelagibacter sp.]